jgi:hypothetical protein
MASHTAMSYEPQIVQVNEELTPESFIDLTLMQHPHDENLAPQEVCICLKVDPLQTWYYHISLNSCTLVILL